MQIDYYRKMKNVQRLARTPKLREYNLLEHSYMVLILFMHFADKEYIKYDKSVIDLILHHDILESVTGDLTWDIKNLNDVTQHSWNVIEQEVLKDHQQLKHYQDLELSKVLNPVQFKLFKICDLLDLWIFLKEEEGLGNHSKEALEIIERANRLIKGKFKSVDEFMYSYKF